MGRGTKDGICEKEGREKKNREQKEENGDKNKEGKRGWMEERGIGKKQEPGCIMYR